MKKIKYNFFKNCNDSIPINKICEITGYDDISIATNLENELMEYGCSVYFELAANYKAVTKFVVIYVNDEDALYFEMKYNL